MIETAWRNKAACRGMDISVFFPATDEGRTNHHSAEIRKAKEVCRTCPVQKECLSYALNSKERHGIWGGVSIMNQHRFSTRLQIARVLGVDVEISTDVEQLGNNPKEGVR